MSRAKALARSRQFACEADIDLIQWLVSKYRPTHTVILGAGSGTMSLAWLEVPEAQLTMALTSIDNDIAALQWEALAWEHAGHVRSENVVQLRWDSAEAAELFDEPLDLLIVDADHSHEGVMRDLEAWLPKISPGGLVMLHDYDAKDAPNLWVGVKAAADEWLIGPTWRLLTRCGWSAVWIREGGPAHGGAPS